MFDLCLTYYNTKSRMNQKTKEVILKKSRVFGGGADYFINGT